MLISSTRVSTVVPVSMNGNTMTADASFCAGAMPGASSNAICPNGGVGVNSAGSIVSVGVAVGRSVEVDVFVRVAVGVLLAVDVGRGVRVLVKVGVEVGGRVGVAVRVAVRVRVGDGTVLVAVGIRVRV